MALRPGLTALIPTFGEDVVAIFEQREDGDDVQILQGANLMQASVGEDVTFFKHPLENGRALVDHRIIQPVTIELRVILTTRSSIARGAITNDLDFEVTAQDIYNQLREIFLTGTVLSIQTRMNTYPNHVFQGIPHDETPEVFDGAIFSVSSSEIQFETANVSFSPANAKNSNTVDRGKQNPLGLPTSVSEVTSIFGA